MMKRNLLLEIIYAGDHISIVLVKHKCQDILL